MRFIVSAINPIDLEVRITDGFGDEISLRETDLQLPQMARQCGFSTLSAIVVEFFIQ
jgi:hypothetical protein